MDYENDVKNQQDQLDIEEKRIILMNKNPKLARKKYGKMGKISERNLMKTVRKDTLRKFRAIENRYQTADHTNIKYIHKQMLSEMDLKLNYKLIKTKLEAKLRRDETREILKTREAVKKKLIQEMKAQRLRSRGI